MTITDHLNRAASPKFCRLSAKRRDGSPMSRKDIADAAFLAESTVARICAMDSWEPSLSLGTVERFMAACGVNPFAVKQQRRYLRKGAKALFSRAHPAQRRMFSRILMGIKCEPTAGLREDRCC